MSDAELPASGRQKIPGAQKLPAIFAAPQRRSLGVDSNKSIA